MIFKCKYFKLQELISPIVYDKYGEFAWCFFNKEILEDLDKIREEYKETITINSWLWGGNTTQCGFRSNLDKLVKDKKTLYCSAHCMGKAFDLHCSNNIKLYNLIYSLILHNNLKSIKRIESRASTNDCWVHIDSFQTTKIVFTL